MTAAADAAQSLPSNLVGNISEPVEVPPHASQILQSNVIILDDSPPRKNKRTSSASLPPKQSTMKSEPINLDVGPVPASTIKDPDASPVNKRINLEPGTPAPKTGEDPVLQRLKEEDERMEDELEAARRLALLLRERDERKAKIAAMEARSSAAPGSRVPQ